MSKIVSMSAGECEYFKKGSSAFSAYYDEVFKVVKGRVSRYHLDRMTIEDIACQAIAYAATYYLKQEKEVEKKGLTRLATWKASNLCKDVFRKTGRADLISLDRVLTNEDGEEMEESPLIARHSAQRGREMAYDRKWMALGGYALKNVEKMFDRLGLSPLRRRVFTEIYLLNLPVEETCRRCGIRPNYAYGIVHSVKKGLGCVGRDFLNAA